MKITPALLLLFVFVLASPSLAQTVRPTPTPRAIKGEDVVVISTELIQIDVTVTDKNGKIVSDLTADDFEIFENNEKQAISNFSFIDVQSSQPLAKNRAEKKPKNDLPDPVSPVHLRPEQVRRTIALVVDDLGLSFSSIFFVQKSLKKFVDEQMQPGDLVAIIRTGGGIGVLQQFTADKNLLYASIERIRFNSNSRVGVSSFAPIKPTSKEEFNSTMNAVASGETPLNEFTLGTAEDLAAERSFNEFRAGGFAVGTLGALSYVVRGMSDMPGRKAVALLSEGFSLFEADGGLNPRIEGALKNLTDLANRSSVVIYTVDPRGLVVPGMTAEDNVLGLRDDPFAVATKMKERDRALEDSQQSLRNLAVETGGDAFLNQNDINRGIDRILEKQGSYYLIGYQPDSESFDPNQRKFNKLTVRIKRPGLRLNYRSGFFGVSDAAAKSRPQGALQQIADALNSPFAKNEISVRMNALFINNEKGSSMRSFLHVKGDEIRFSEDAEGYFNASFNVLVLLFNDDGMISDSVDRVEKVRLKAEAYREVSEKGLVYSLHVPIKKAGNYQMRMAIQDKATQKIGSVSQFIQVPDLKKKKLVVSGIALQYDRAPGSGLNLVQTDERRELALRQFKANSTLRFGFAVYNSRVDRASNTPLLTSQMRIFSNGTEIFRGDETPISAFEQVDAKNVNIKGVFTLGKNIRPGDYVMQIIVRDKLQGAREFVAQTVDFEIVE